MLKSLTHLSLAATLSLANAQSADSAPQAGPEQSQAPAPIVRSYQSGSYQQRRPWRQPDQIAESQPTPGVWLRSESASVVKTVSATAQRTEVRLERGRLNVTVHQPAQHAEILVDLPGGQTSLLKDGLYTFNADTNTVRVLRGEAAYLGSATGEANAKPIKIREEHQLSLVAVAGEKPGRLKPEEAYPYELTADLLPPDLHGEPGRPGGYAGNGYIERGYPGYWGDYPAYPYPYYAGPWRYPYGFYPGYYGYGYPFAYRIGIGYYRGFGYHGGFRR